jgi:hypothetical protein
MGLGNDSNAVNSNDQSIVEVAVSVLPTGAATSANQTTEITSLQLLDDVVATTASAIPSKGYAISGTDGTNARIIKTNTSGNIINEPYRPTSVTVSNKTVTTSSTEVLASNSNRRYFILSCPGSAGCFVQFGNSPALTANNGIKIAAGDKILFGADIGYTGAINAIVASGTATLQVIEGT